MHPGQYTVLNSPDEAVVERAVTDISGYGKILPLLVGFSVYVENDGKVKYYNL